MDSGTALYKRLQVEAFQRRHRVSLLTLVFTDVVGSTRLKQDLGDGPAIQLLQCHHEEIRRLLAFFPEAEEINTAGDSFFIVFTKPSDAVRFSLQVQARMRQPLEIDAPLVRDRIGIHVGEVFVFEPDQTQKSKDLFGIQVDTAARIASLSEADQILLSRAAFDSARQVLKGESVVGVALLSWLNHGPYLLKGVEEPLEICEVGEIGKSRLQPPVDTDKVHRHISPDSEPVLGWRPSTGQIIPKTQWMLEDKIGEGGFGEVWKARHQKLNALRVFKFCFRADRVRALKREVTLFRLLQQYSSNHPNIVRLFDFRFDEAPYYIELEHVDGPDLKAWCAAQANGALIPLHVRLEIVAQIAEALQSAHAAGVVHRDIKPANMLVGLQNHAGTSSPNENKTSQRPPQARLTDFGIGLITTDAVSPGITRSGFTQTLGARTSNSQSGTLMYLAPELIAGCPATPSSDVYSLGVVLFQLLICDLNRPLTPGWETMIPDPLLRHLIRQACCGNPGCRSISAGQLAAGLRSFPTQKRALSKYSVALCIVLTVGLTLISLLRPEPMLWSYDLLTRLQPTRQPHQAAIVYEDADSFQKLRGGLKEWDRKIHATLVRTLAREGAKAIAFSGYVFDEESRNSAADLDLTKAMKESQRTILSAVVARPSSQRLLDLQAEITVLPLDKFLNSASAFGRMQIELDRDRRVRRHPVEGETPSLAWATAAFAGATLPKNPGEKQRERWIQYYGPPGSIPSVSYFAVTPTNTLPPGFFKDKVVFVGSPIDGAETDGVLLDQYSGPFPPNQTKHLSASEIQATIFLNLIRGEWITVPPAPIHQILIFVTATVFGWWLSRLSALNALLAGGAGTLFVMALAYASFASFGLCWNWLSLVAVAIPSAVSWKWIWPVFLEHKCVEYIGRRLRH